MQLFKNTDVYPRVWNDLQDPRSGSTLILFPDDVVELDLPEGFEDPYLKPVAASSKSKRGTKSDPDSSSSNAADAEPEAQKESES